MCGDEQIGARSARLADEQIRPRPASLADEQTARIGARPAELADEQIDTRPADNRRAAEEELDEQMDRLTQCLQATE